MWKFLRTARARMRKKTFAAPPRPTTDGGGQTTVEAVVINWKRPRNVARIVERLRGQSYPCRVTIVECAPPGAFRLPDHVLNQADDVYMIRRNHGPFSRYIPAFAYDCDFTYFGDDDMLPGARLVEHFVTCAGARPDAGLLGQLGRKIDDRYTSDDVPRRPDDFVEVDMLVRGYFVRTERLIDLLRFKRAWRTEAREDDMLLAMGVRTFSDQKILLTPDSGDPEEGMKSRELPAAHALCYDPVHYNARQEFWRRAAEMSDRLRRVDASPGVTTPATTLVTTTGPAQAGG